MQENQYYSYNLGELPLGCQFCVRGEKLVLFVTGICPRKCYFCPLSDLKYGKDVVLANEREVTAPADVLKEANLMEAKGAGITGGDPLSQKERTVEYIALLKKTFGSEFHIHLYTSLVLVNEENLALLFKAGLDEIRFHPELDLEERWEKIGLAGKFPWKIGVEIPLIPTKEKEIKRLIDFIQGKVHFLNLNELEMADNSLSQLGEMGFRTKDEFSYAVKGSLELGLELIEYVKNKKYAFSVHLCTAKLKDAVQLANRIKRESRQVRKKFDLVDEEGMLTRGALYLKELAPGASYREKLKMADKKAAREKLAAFWGEIKEKLKFKEDDFYLDTEKPRILLSKKNVLRHREFFLKRGLLPAIVTEYPTADQLEVEVELLGEQ